VPCSQTSAPAPGVRLELGPLGRCPRPLPRAPTLEDWTILAVMMAFWGCGQSKTSPATIHTEFDMRAPLFPKEQVPASTPIPPREVGTILLGMMAFCRCSASVARNGPSRPSSAAERTARAAWASVPIPDTTSTAAHASRPMPAGDGPWCADQSPGSSRSRGKTHRATALRRPARPGSWAATACRGRWPRADSSGQRGAKPRGARRVSLTIPETLLATATR
jgi:hypothetical protein